MKENTKARHEVKILPQLDKACGLDIHKDKIVAFISDKEGKEQFLEEFGTFTRDLKKIRDLLKDNGVQDCIMESTGVYWISLYSILTAAGINVIVANPQHIKQIPKRKTDRKDARWLCTLLLNGLVRKSFVPSPQLRNLRDLTRNRLFYTRHISRIKNRIVKILETNNIKIRSVVSNISTKSSMAIIELLSKGETDIDKLVSCCKGSTRKKANEMSHALEGSLGETERVLLTLMLEDIRHYEKQLTELEHKICRIIEETYSEVVRCLVSVSGIGQQSAEEIVAEIGDNMDVFPSPDHLTAWVGVAPGNNESAGKRKDTSSKKGNKYLKRTIIAVAWAAVRTKDSYWRCLYQKLTKRMKSNKAIVAVARRILKVVYKTIRNKELYVEKGKEHFFEIQQRNALKNVCPIA